VRALNHFNESLAANDDRSSLAGASHLKEGTKARHEVWGIFSTLGDLRRERDHQSELWFLHRKERKFEERKARRIGEKEKSGVYLLCKHQQITLKSGEPIL
jgi:hypothetical protein